MKSIFTISLLLAVLLSFGQDYPDYKLNIFDFPIPRNMESCFKTLDKTLTDNQIQALRSAAEDSVLVIPEFANGAYFYRAWRLNSSSRMTKYLNKKGLFEASVLYEYIVISYYRYLNNLPYELEEQVQEFRYRQETEYAVSFKNMTADSIDGKYIPKDLEDCFFELNKIIAAQQFSDDKEKEKFIDSEEFGRWLRNRWGLWSDSRLKRYLLERGVDDIPDNMSYLILDYYKDWLNGENKEWKKFDRKKLR